MRHFGLKNQSVFDTIEHDKHRRKREPWSPYFSKQSISRLQSLIQASVNKLGVRFAAHQAAGKPVKMLYAYSCLTADIISEYSFPAGYNLLDEEEFDTEQWDAWMALGRQGHMLKQFGWLLPLFDAMPLWITRTISPAMCIALNLKGDLMRHAVEIIKRRDQLDSKQSLGRPSLIHSFLDSKLPDVEKSPGHLAAEAQTSIGAGVITTTMALTAATYHILADPSVFDTLMTELLKAISDPSNSLDLKELEQIPYLVAVMYETLRIFQGVSHRLQRIFPDRPFQFKEWCVPAGTPTGMTAMLVHNNPEVFPEPYNFKPDRWLPLQTEGQRLQKYLLPFSKGTRACAGMELAKAEILMTLASIFRRYGPYMKLVDTVRERDIDVSHDYVSGHLSEGSHGLMVMFEQETNTSLKS